MTLDYIAQVLHISPLTAATTLIVLLLGILYAILKDKSLPPGPVGFPFVGYWPFLPDENIHIHFQELIKKYGDVFSFRVAGKLFIHLGSLKAIKEAQLTKSDAFSQRYTGYSVLSLAFGKGIANSNGEEWKVQRKFFVQAFREYGLLSLKDHLAGPTYDTINETIDILRATDCSPVNIIPILNVRSLAIFRRMMFNDGEVTEQEIQAILDAYGKVINIFTGKNLLLIGDFARKYLFPRLENFNEAVENVKVMESYLKKIIRRHEDTFDRDNIRDVIDSYIKERKDRSSKGDPRSEYFSEDALVGSLSEFVGDGILTLSVFVASFFYELLKYPEEQEKIHKELVDVVGHDRGVTMEDRNKLPYTNAFMLEVLRTTDIFTYLASLESTKETTLNGYKIPAGSITLMNLWASHRDPAVFGDPDEFKPSRYITEQGKPKTELPILFGVGKRACAGEAFTMMQVFLFLATIVKNFKLEHPKGEVTKFYTLQRMDICAYPRN